MTQNWWLLHPYIEHHKAKEFAIQPDYHGLLASTLYSPTGVINTCV